MSINDLRNKVSEMCIDGVIRCLREKTTIGQKYPFTSVNTKINSEVMRYYWALSKGIEEIAHIVIRNSRRMTSGISYVQVERKGEITGSLNASETILAQARTLDPTLFIVNEPSVTYHSEPNHLLAWTLKEAYDVLLSARRLYRGLDNFQWFNDKVSLLENSLRNDVLKEILISPLGKKRPNRSTLRAASKSRVVLYQKTVLLYNMLERIEAGDDEAIKSCLNETLVADLEYWQQLELGTGLEAAIAIGRSIHEPVKLIFPFISGEPIAEVGDYKIYWQYPIPQRSDDKLETNEKWTKEIAGNIGITLSDSRADVVLCHHDQVKCIFECKYSESDIQPAQAIVDAISQLVRYARDLNSDSLVEAETFLEKCFIVVADCKKYSPINSVSGSGVRSKRILYFSDVANISDNSLETWARELS